MAIFAHQKPNLGDIRLTEAKKGIFKQAADLYSLKEGVTILASLIGEPVEEIYCVTKYSQETGEPLVYDWKSKGPWNGHMPYGYLWRGSGTDYDNLLESLKSVIPVGELRVIRLKDNQHITIIHHPFGSENKEAGRAFSLIKTTILP